MKNLATFCLLTIIIATGCKKTDGNSTNTMKPTSSKPAYAMAIHGGAGAISKANMPPEKEKEYKAALDSALTIGEQILQKGGSAMDAVTQTIVFLENCPLFNAGRGAVFTHESKNELDASIMDGTSQKAGAVGGVTTVKNPILLARTIMEQSAHVLLTGQGAEQFAREKGLEMVDPKWFYTQDCWNALQKALEAEKKDARTGEVESADYKYGTVGCVALDQNGHLAAGTSTGGMTNKRWNRLGDSPIIGAGTYASNDACAVSCTGHGEYFIRYAVAYDICAQMTYGGKTLEQATQHTVMEKLVAKGGSGGLIALDTLGNICQPFNSEGMYRGWVKPGQRYVGIYKE